MSSKTTYILSTDTFKTIWQGALGAMTFGAYHQFNTNRIMDLNTKYMTDKHNNDMNNLTNQHNNDMNNLTDKLTNQHNRDINNLTEKFNKLENDQKSRWW